MPRGTISVLESLVTSLSSQVIPPRILNAGSRQMWSDAASRKSPSERHGSRSDSATGTTHTMNLTKRSRSGLALPMVLGAITLIATLIAGVMYLATQDYRVGANSLNEARAEAAAEMGLNRLTTDW